MSTLLLRREQTGLGGLVETSLLEGMLDLQFENLSAYLNELSVERSRRFGAHAFLPRPLWDLPDKERVPCDRHGVGQRPWEVARPRGARSLRRALLLVERAGRG